MSTPARPLITRLFNAAVITLLATPVLFVQSTLATPPVTERVSVDSAGYEGDRVSRSPSLTSDGQLIAFASEATNLVEGDSNGAQDIFLHDWLTGATMRLSLDAEGQEANAASAWPEISSDGSWVTFSSAASNLVEGDTNGVEDIFGAVMRMAPDDVLETLLAEHFTAFSTRFPDPVGPHGNNLVLLQFVQPVDRKSIVPVDA